MSVEGGVSSKKAEPVAGGVREVLRTVVGAGRLVFCDESEAAVEAGREGERYRFSGARWGRETVLEWARGCRKWGLRSGAQAH